MPSCYAYRCSNHSNTSSEITFHRLPGKNKCLSIRKKWLANIKRGGELPKEEHFVICSQHFDEDCFKRDLKVSIVCIYTVSKRCFVNIGYSQGKDCIVSLEIFVESICRKPMGSLFLVK